MASTDRFSSQEHVEWNEGAFWDGHRARCDGHSILACPYAEEFGDWYCKSWAAGWADADMSLAHEEEIGHGKR